MVIIWANNALFILSEIFKIFFTSEISNNQLLYRRINEFPYKKNTISFQGFEVFVFYLAQKLHL